MYRLKKRELWASDVAAYLNCQLVGKDILLDGPRAFRVVGAGQAPCASECANCLFILDSAATAPASGITCLQSDHPERDLALTLLEFFATPIEPGVHPTACVSPGAKVGRNARIGPHVVIGDDVEIGDDAWLMGNITVHGPATIGKRAVVKDGAVIGSEGYGFVEDETGRLIHAPQLGHVLIGNHVWIGSNSTIERGMLGDTVVEDDVKIDDLVHIGQGSIIGKKSLITAGCVIAFHVHIGEGVRLGTNVSVREFSRIASKVIVGQGAAVVNDLMDPGVYVGVPARRLEKTH